MSRESSDLEGEFVRLVNRDKGVVAWSNGSVTAYLFIDKSGGLEVPLQLLVNTDRLDPVHAMPRLSAMLASWEAPAESAPLTALALRGVPIGRMLAESRRVAAAIVRDDEVLGYQPPLSLLVEGGKRLGFRSTSQFAAAQLQVQAAWAYATATLNGDNRPVQYVASALCAENEREARNLITSARRNGYLTKGVAGRPGGQLTLEGEAILNFMREVGAGRQEGTGDGSR